MIIGRSKQQKILERAYQSKTAEFIMVYGLRRVGKTYLISEFFKNRKGYFLQTTGLQGGTKAEQLKKFKDELAATFFDGADLAPFKNWDEAFRLLHKQIERSDQKVVVFLDELPWMATRRSTDDENAAGHSHRLWIFCFLACSKDTI